MFMEPTGIDRRCIGVVFWKGVGTGEGQSAVGTGYDDNVCETVPQEAEVNSTVHPSSAPWFYAVFKPST